MKRLFIVGLLFWGTSSWGSNLSAEKAIVAVLHSRELAAAKTKFSGVLNLTTITPETEPGVLGVDLFYQLAEGLCKVHFLVKLEDSRASFSMILVKLGYNECDGARP